MISWKSRFPATSRALRPIVFLVSIPVFAINYPSLPIATVDVSCCPAVTRTVAVHTAAQLQAALSSAQLGDNIVLDAGATYEGNFILSIPSGSTGWVTLTSTAAFALPSPGTRVGPSDAVHMAKIMSPSSGDSIGDNTYPALAVNLWASNPADLGVHHY